MKEKGQVVKHAPQRSAGGVRKTDVYVRRGTSERGVRQRVQTLLDGGEAATVYATGAAIRGAVRAVRAVAARNPRVQVEVRTETVSVTDEVFEGVDALPRHEMRRTGGICLKVTVARL